MTRTAPSSRDKILDVAEALFARRGYAGVGMREVAEVSGLSKSSLFHHFRGKAPLYCEVLGRVLCRIEERVSPVFAAPDAPARRLERGIGALVDALAEHPTSARLLLRGLFEDDEFLLDPPPEAEAAEAIVATLIRGLETLLREGMEAGEFRDASIPDTVQTVIGATVYHFASGDVGEGVLGAPLFSAEAVRRRKRELIDLLLHGLSAKGAGSAVDDTTRDTGE